MLNEWTTGGSTSHRAPRSPFMIISFWLICIKLQRTNEICIKVRTCVRERPVSRIPCACRTEHNRRYSIIYLCIYVDTQINAVVCVSAPGCRVRSIVPQWNLCAFSRDLFITTGHDAKNRCIVNWLDLIRYVPRIRLTSDRNGTRVMSMQTHYNQPIESLWWREAGMNCFSFPFYWNETSSFSIRGDAVGFSAPMLSTWYWKRATKMESNE